MNKDVVLVVDDDKSIRELLTILLNNQDIDVIAAKDGLEALELLKKNKVDLIILDVMMPKMDGMVTCMQIRKTLNIPIIILSAKAEDADQILGLTIGADDYMPKPFNSMLLIAKVKSHIRRYKDFNLNTSGSSSLIKIEDMLIDLDKHEVQVGDNILSLTPHEFDILSLLAQNANKVLSIRQIYESVWKDPYLESDRTVTVHIRRLRQKLKKDYIKTVWGVGYKIEN